MRAGGGVNHRGNLSDWVMLKDNHLALFGIADAVARARRRWPGAHVHVECGDLDQVAQALEAGADAVLLDNMTPEEVRGGGGRGAGRRPRPARCSSSRGGITSRRSAPTPPPASTCCRSAPSPTRPRPSTSASTSR